MKILTKVLVFLCLMPLASYAQNFAERVKATHTITDQTFDIDCFYSRNLSFKLITAVSDTIKGPNQITREFIIENQNRKVPMSFTLLRTNKTIEYNVLLDKTHLSKGKVSKREFLIAPIANKEFSNEFETSKISCNINFATARPFVLRDGNYHFNVHPHTIYDWQSKLKGVVEAYLNNDQYKSIILLESSDYRGNLVDINRFLNGEEAKLPLNTLISDLEHVPASTPLIVSPSGNSRYQMEAETEINITFTGGNHNYCIWNSARHVLIGLMNSKSEAKVNFYYDTKAIVAQPKGMEGLSINFSKQDINKSNLLSDLFSKESARAGYHFSYLIYFRNLFAQEYSGMYRTFKVNYSAEGYNESFTMMGGGDKDLEVNFNYL